jgi:aminoglycoside phosphotransferase (APT) family kinase protein
MTSAPDTLVPQVLRRLLPAVMAGAASAAHVDFEWRPLAGGLNVRSFLVRADGRRWVLRLPLPGAPALIDVRTEARVMSAAAASGIAPQVVAVDAPSGALLTDYAADARAWDVVTVREPRNIERAAALLRTLHGLVVEAPAYSAVGIAERYAASVAEARRPGGSQLAGKPEKPEKAEKAEEGEEAEWAEQLTLLATRYDARHEPTVLCHNDLAAANVLDDGRRLQLVDFEYAVRSAPILDLAGLIAMNDYSAAESRALANAYYGETAALFHMRELANVVRMIRLMSFFWARIGEHVARDSAPYTQLAAAMAERLRADANFGQTVS